jgi:hypothetical protein
MYESGKVVRYSYASNSVPPDALYREVQADVADWAAPCRWSQEKLPNGSRVPVPLTPMIHDLPQATTLPGK